MSLPYVLGGSWAVPLSSGSQGLIDLGSGNKWRKVEIQGFFGTGTSAVVHLQPTKGGITDVFSTASKTKWGAITASTATAAFANQPAGDSLHVASDDASDITQTVTVYATTATGGNVRAYSARLNGTTRVNIASELSTGYFQTVLGIELSAVCAGTITLEEASADADIKTIATTILSKGVTDIPVGSQKAYGLPVCVSAASGTKIVGVYGEPVDADGSFGEEVTHATTSVLYTRRSYSRITKVLWGDVADTVVCNFGQYGIGPCTTAITGSAAGVINDMGLYTAELNRHRYIAWASYNSSEALTTGGAADRLQVTVYG